LTFFCKDLPDIQYPMSADSASTGGWADSDMRQFTNGELRDALTDSLKQLIAPVIKISDGGRTNKTLVETIDYCWLASIDEINLLTNRKDTLYGQGEPYAKVFSDGASRIKYLIDTTDAERWNVRTTSYGSDSQFYHRITTSGGTYPEPCHYEYYVAFGFCIK
jgi:hypothetical protein